MEGVSYTVHSRIDD